ncbi:MAG: class II aldolase/adducin family protein [Candidatus Obscuribacterales bacterium]|nr:class II aldolase/adducin family protein [Candidatus Obscuribacterales bacterium]
MLSQPEELALRQELIEVSRLLYQRGYLSGTEGNLSLRLGDDLLLSTASATSKGRIKASEILLSDLDGNLMPSLYQGSRNKLSTELRLHLTAYKERPDIRAIVHAHPVTAVGFTLAGKSLLNCCLPEVICNLGSIPTAPYATPSTEALAKSILPFVKDYDAILLAHHGAITLGEDIWQAFYKMETVETFAKTMLVAETLGGARDLAPQEIKELLAIRSVYGLSRAVKTGVE